MIISTADVSCTLIRPPLQARVSKTMNIRVSDRGSFKVNRSQELNTLSQAGLFISGHIDKLDMGWRNASRSVSQ
ncbi:hypothetical protein TNCV_4923111 [Trichonephila clavipes]|nr:hypothetical protein TNCV_4923111 [Trichonephila clavipes]